MYDDNGEVIAPTLLAATGFAAMEFLLIAIPLLLLGIVLLARARS